MYVHIYVYTYIHINKNLKDLFLNKWSSLEVGLWGNIYFSVLIEFLYIRKSKIDSSLGNKVFPE